MNDSAIWSVWGCLLNICKTKVDYSEVDFQSKNVSDGITQDTSPAMYMCCQLLKELNGSRQQPRNHHFE